MRALVLDQAATKPSWRFWGRFMEILPGASAWLFLISPVVLSFVEPMWVAFLIIAYDLIWLTKSFGIANRIVRGYGRLRRTNRVDWHARLDDLNHINQAIARVDARLKANRLPTLTRLELTEYRKFLKQAEGNAARLDPTQIYQAVIVATLNESLAIIEPSIQALLKSHFDKSKLWLFIAYEERGGNQTEQNAKYLIKAYGPKFGFAQAVKHPAAIPGEAKAKAGNITFAGRQLARYAAEQGIAPEQVMVTTLDADNRPSPQYFAYLSTVYAAAERRTHKSYQPLPMFLNNIWDVPAAMRIVATGNSFWILAEAVRPHRLRNFSSHAQSLQTLIDTDFWMLEAIRGS